MVQEEIEDAKRKRGQLKSAGWVETRERKVTLPETTGRTLVMNLHQAAHLGSTKLSQLLRPKYALPRLDSPEWDVSVK